MCTSQYIEIEEVIQGNAASEFTIYSCYGLLIRTKKWHILPIRLASMLSSVAGVSYMQNVECVISLSKSCLLRNSGKKSSPVCCKSMLTDKINLN